MALSEETFDELKPPFCCEYFTIIGRDTTSKILKTKVLRKYEKGAIISHGNASPNVFVVRKGIVKVLTYFVDGREFVVDTSNAGKLIGEIDVLRRTKPPFEAHALTDCELWILDGRIIRDSVASCPEIGANLLEYAVKRIAELEEKLIFLAKMSISARLADTLLKLSSTETRQKKNANPTIVNVSQYEIASMLPASREKVNRCLRTWERSRIVHLSPGTITITNPRALHEYALNKRQGLPDAPGRHTAGAERKLR